LEVEKGFYKNQPRMVLFEITTRCNLACSYCTARQLVKEPKDLEIDKIRELRPALEAFEYIAFCGLGEALIHKNFYEILEIFKDKKIVIVTNGSVPIDYERLVRYDNIDAITFSVDGATEDSMKRVCSRYKFDVLLKNLEEGSKYGVNCAFNTTITEDTYKELSGIQDMIVKYGVKCFKLGLPLGKERWVSDHSKEIHDALYKIRDNMKELSVIYEDPFEVKCCCDNAPIAVVSKNGNLYPCCDYFCGRPLVGNLYHNSFMNIWNKGSYEGFREGKFCSRCKQYHNLKEIADQEMA
jgi:MoaA/NifB/PqqE/SkfB family radical SAM enzyme